VRPTEAVGFAPDAVEHVAHERVPAENESGAETVVPCKVPSTPEETSLLGIFDTVRSVVEAFVAVSAVVEAFVTVRRVAAVVKVKPALPPESVAGVPAVEVHHGICVAVSAEDVATACVLAEAEPVIVTGVVPMMVKPEHETVPEQEAVVVPTPRCVVEPHHTS